MKNSTARRAGGLAFAVALAWLAPGCDSSPDRPRAVVLISIDTLRADHLGAYGHHRFTSPVLDEFAAKGVVFEDASATTGWTLPSHASMLTGLFPLRHGVITGANALSEEVPTLAGWFNGAGWDTAAIVNVLWLKRELYGLTRDFEKYLFIAEADYRRRGPSSWATDQAMEWLRDQQGRSLFLFLHYYDVHADYASLPEYERLFVSPYEGHADGSAWQIERSNFPEGHIAHCLEEPESPFCRFGSQEKPRRIDAEMERVEFDERDVQHLEELYDAGIRQLDTELGRLLGFLESSGRMDDTLVVITSDHGEEFLEHGRLGHSLTTYQQSLRVPLIMRGPGLPAGVRVTSPVSLVDLAPTLLALSGLAAGNDLDGLNLSGLWRGADPRPFAERYLFGEASQGVQEQSRLPGVYPIFRSVRRGNFKLVARTLGSETEYALYDLAEDPGELRDIAAGHPAQVAEMAAVLQRRHGVGGEASPGGKAVELDPDEIDQLRALGYAP